jgi:hypothetical protein
MAMQIKAADMFHFWLSKNKCTRNTKLFFRGEKMTNPRRKLQNLWPRVHNLPRPANAPHSQRLH